MEAHEVLSCVELVIYILLFPLVSFLAVYYLCLTRREKQTAWLFLNAFTVAKIAGPAIAIYLDSSNTNSTGGSVKLQIASQILNQIALGPLLSATLSFVNTSVSRRLPLSPRNQDIAVESNQTQRNYYSYLPLQSRNQNGEGEGKFIPIVLRLIHPIIVCGLVLGIYGGVKRSPDSSTGETNADDYKSGVTFSKVSSVLFLVAIATLYGTVLLKQCHQTRSKRAHGGFETGSFVPESMMLVLILPLLFVRVIYSLLYSFNLNMVETLSTQSVKTVPSKYDPANGSWVIYLLLGLVPQVTVVTSYTIYGTLSWIKDRSGA
ncbi:hypothetical protein BGW36DRAFT_433862 [Talaromyces proteolyticus]|uniref:DUF7702 domain-containing protein n=1 Tax=Talaromyces proteolyticus TaxID=1131652 RepID=A0AAD4KGN5_9EURO|nr:uncharacterized protein BGW36DRAFT_433862 [Talaromyces proteolyticus]KAH8689097.1 hypothetical protein BGW36DRAFT_433862 [Talaromyces proteolyticus]